MLELMLMMGVLTLLACVFVAAWFLVRHAKPGLEEPVELVAAQSAEKITHVFGHETVQTDAPPVVEFHRVDSESLSAAIFDSMLQEAAESERQAGE